MATFTESRHPVFIHNAGAKSAWAILNPVEVYTALANLAHATGAPTHGSITDSMAQLALVEWYNTQGRGTLQVFPSLYHASEHAERTNSAQLRTLLTTAAQPTLYL